MTSCPGKQRDHVTEKIFYYLMSRSNQTRNMDALPADVTYEDDIVFLFFCINENKDGGLRGSFILS